MRDTIILILFAMSIFALLGLGLYYGFLAFFGIMDLAINPTCVEVIYLK